MENKRKQSLNFRQEEVGHIMTAWRASLSCSMIGTGSVGKSNLIQHLMDTDVQAYFMQEVAQGKPFKSINIDPNLLVPLSSTDAGSEPIRCWAGYELMMHRLFLAFYPFEILGDDAAQFYSAYTSLQDGTNPLYAQIGLRYFELGLEMLLQRGAQIVFMFDEFEELMKKLPVKFFLTLRGIRDRYKGQVAYMTFSRAPIAEIADNLGIDPLEIEPFTELFSDNLIYVGPYNDADASDMLVRLVNRSGKAYNEDILRFLMWASGCHAGLLRASFNALELLPQPLPDRNTLMQNGAQIARQLSNRSIVRTECRGIWGSLNSTEKALLTDMVRAGRFDTNDIAMQNAFTTLVKKKLIRIDQNTMTVEPVILRAYIETGME
jgi:hypothetical protein